ncbi:MAG: NAD(P)/FAD-dependent oxidoreductase [Ignavibacteriales bacterium]|nr:NAD(P)/FAD-dependent oxidoreductase [Ignavibacteriales bacterium]
MKKYDVAIIGGGPAGSVAALSLNKLGFEVCLIEKKSFPRETLCGEFLSREVTSNLQRLDLFENFLLLQPNPITSFKFFYDNGKFIKSDLNFTGYGLKRGRFDNFLLKSGKEKGIEVLQPVEVKEIKFRNDKYHITIHDGSFLSEITADKVIAAYGRQNILDKKLNRKFLNSRSYLNGIKFHVDDSAFHNLEKDTIKIFTSADIYCGINTVDENKVTVCFLEKRNNGLAHPREQLKKLMMSNKSFGSLFNDSIYKVLEELPVYGTGNIYFGNRELVKDGIYMIGDAAAVIAPLTGDGIGMAVESASLVADVFHKQRFKKLDDLETEKIYIKEWRSLFNKRIATAKTVQRIILNNHARKIGFSFIKTFPGILKAMIHSTRG